MNIIVAILIFTVIIVIHELGHFLLAKKNGIFVTEFSVGMGPRLITFVKTAKGYKPRFLLSQHDFEHTAEWKDTTKYSWKLFPIGGSCMMLGEDENIEDDRAFNKKGVWARISVTFAGPIFNFILAFLLAIVLISLVGYDHAEVTVVDENSKSASVLEVGDIITEINGSHIDNARDLAAYLYYHPVTAQDLSITYVRDGVKHKALVPTESVKSYKIGLNYAADNPADFEYAEGMPLADAGLKKGDIIISINSVEIKTRNDISTYMEQHPLTDEAVTITYTRDGVENTVEVTPVLTENFYVGFDVSATRVKTGVFGVIKNSIIEVKYLIASTVESVGMLITGKVKTDDMAGPVGIVNYIGETYEESKSDGALTVFVNLLYISILLSANLGVMNLLPIPALDGGRLLFLIVEVFRGKPVDQSKEGIIHMIGFVALMILMVFILFNDISNIFF